MDLLCINDKPLTGNDVGPPLIEGATYGLKEIVVDSKGNEHYDVGLLSQYSYVSSFETGNHLRDGDIIHWCHPSRFLKIES